MSDNKLLDTRKNAILQMMTSDKWLPARDISVYFPDLSPATLRRELGWLVEHGLLEKKGENRGVKYARTERARLLTPYQLGVYYQQNEDERDTSTDYNFAIFPAMRDVDCFSEAQISQLAQATMTFHRNAEGMKSAVHQKELERFVIEFSWKSSKIEGNTYSLLDTEFLLKNGIEAQGKTKHEATMILNHKNAYLFVVESMRNNVPINAAYIEHIHHLVTDGLGVERGVRNRIVGISGSLYLPLTMQQQLREQLEVLTHAIARKDNAYEQALMAVLGISYLQPFEDGNKRTARVFANALLLHAGYAPLSYRSIDEREYKEATLIFYEQNSLVPFRDLFVEQYVYSATHYNIAVPN